MAATILAGMWWLLRDHAVAALRRWLRPPPTNRTFMGPIGTMGTSGGKVYVLNGIILTERTYAARNEGHGAPTTQRWSPPSRLGGSSTNRGAFMA